MTVYAESSAVLAWLMGEDPGDAVRGALDGADVVITSDLTLVECDRVLIRASARTMGFRLQPVSSPSSPPPSAPDE